MEREVLYDLYEGGTLAGVAWVHDVRSVEQRDGVWSWLRRTLGGQGPVAVTHTYVEFAFGSRPDGVQLRDDLLLGEADDAEEWMDFDGEHIEVHEGESTRTYLVKRTLLDHDRIAEWFPLDDQSQ